MREHILLDKLLAWFICIICDIVCPLVMGSAVLGTDPLPFTVKHNQLSYPNWWFLCPCLSTSTLIQTLTVINTTILHAPPTPGSWSEWGRVWVGVWESRIIQMELPQIGPVALIGPSVLHHRDCVSHKAVFSSSDDDYFHPLLLSKVNADESEEFIDKSKYLNSISTIYLTWVNSRASQSSRFLTCKIEIITSILQGCHKD